MRQALLTTLFSLLLFITPLHAQPAADEPLTPTEFGQQFEIRSLQIIDAREKDSDKIILSHLKDNLATRITQATSNSNLTLTRARLENAIAVVKGASIPQIHNQNAMAFLSLKCQLEFDDALQAPLFLPDSPEKIDQQIDAFCSALQAKGMSGAVTDPRQQAMWQALLPNLKSRLKALASNTRTPHLKQIWPQTLTPGFLDDSIAIINRNLADPHFKDAFNGDQQPNATNGFFCTRVAYEIHVPIIMAALKHRRATDPEFEALCKQDEQRHIDMAPAHQQLHTLFEQYSKDLKVGSDKLKEASKAQMRERMKPAQTQPAAQPQPPAPDPTPAT